MQSSEKIVIFFKFLANQFLKTDIIKQSNGSGALMLETNEEGKRRSKNQSKFFEQKHIGKKTLVNTMNKLYTSAITLIFP